MSLGIGTVCLRYEPPEPGGQLAIVSCCVPDPASGEPVSRNWNEAEVTEFTGFDDQVLKVMNLGEELGCGSYGSVRSAVFIKDGVAVPSVVKCPKDEEEEYLEAELEAFRRLQSSARFPPSIVRALGWYKPREGDVSILMEQLGPCLERTTQARVQLKMIARCVLEALRYIHQCGLIHSDVKSRNICWTLDRSRVKLVDVGSCKQTLSEDYLHCTLWYRAPELIAYDTGSNKVDLWSTGVTLLEIYKGYNPFDSGDEVELVERHIRLLGKPRVWAGGRFGLYLDSKSTGLDTNLEYAVCSGSDGRDDTEAQRIYKLIKQLLTYDPKRRPSAALTLRLFSWL